MSFRRRDIMRPAICLLVAQIILPSWVSPHAHAEVARFPLVVQTSNAADRLLLRILDDIAAQRLDDVPAQLDRLEHDWGERMISVAENHLINAELVALLLRSRVNHVRRLDTIRRLLKADLPDAIGSGQGELVDMVLQAADQHWLSGRLDQAHYLWSSLRSVNPTSVDGDWRIAIDPHDRRADIPQRLIVLDVVEGRFRSARQKLDRFEAEFPNLEGRLAGRIGNLTQILADVISAAEDSASAALGTGNSFQPRVPVRIDFVRRLWSVPSAQSISSQRSPLIHEGLVLLSDRRGVRALSLETGQSAWPTDLEDEGYLIENRLASTNPPPQGGLESFCWGGVLVEDLWIGGIGPRWELSSPHDLNLVSSRLAACELQAEGRLRWIFDSASDELQDRGVTGNISGDPATDGEFVYVPLRSSPPDLGVALACLRVSDGKLVWFSRLGSLIESFPGDRGFPGDELHVDRDRVLWNVDGKCALGVRKVDGRLLWATSLPRAPTPARGRPTGSLADRGRLWTLSDQGVLACDTASGQRIWFRELPTTLTQILGASDGMLVVAGDNLWGLDTETGEVRWRTGRPGSVGRGSGRGLLLGRSVFWPTQNELWTVDAWTGEILQRDSFALAGVRGGAVTLFGSRLLISEPDRVSAFEINVTPNAIP